MGKQNTTGVYKMENGYWAFRFKIVVDGVAVNQRRTKDADGNKLLSKTEALRAREAAIAAARIERKRNIKISRRIVKEVFEEYREKGCTGKAYTTLLKQDSLWKNHFIDKWGKRYVDEISAAEVNDYLSELYFENEYAYRYVESFLKIFYLIFVQAYSRNYLDVDAYNKLCVNKDTKITMPKLRVDDDTNIVAFDRSELALLDDYFEGTNAETAYLLGRFCGLRINETYGLKWDHVDLEAGTIFIDRQQQYQNSLIKLVSPKTRNARRTIYLCDKLIDHLKKKKEEAQEASVKFAAVRQQKQRFIEDLDGSMISCCELVNCLPDGTIQTVNSMKYPTREIKSRLGIEFKYHYLRHTYGTLMAEMNTPTHLLCNQMGHGHIHVTQLYYLAVSKTGVDILKDNLNLL